MFLGGFWCLGLCFCFVLGCVLGLFVLRVCLGDFPGGLVLAGFGCTLLLGFTEGLV